MRHWNQQACVAVRRDWVSQLQQQYSLTVGVQKKFFARSARESCFVPLTFRIAALPLGEWPTQRCCAITQLPYSLTLNVQTHHWNQQACVAVRRDWVSQLQQQYSLTEFGRCRGISVFMQNSVKFRENTEIPRQRPNSAARLEIPRLA